MFSRPSDPHGPPAMLRPPLKSDHQALSPPQVHFTSHSCPLGRGQSPRSWSTLITGVDPDRAADAP